MSNVVRLPTSHMPSIPDREDRDWVTSAEIVAESGITYRQLDYWLRTDLLTARTEEHPGNGYVRRFDAEQLDRAAALHALIAAGIGLQVCRLVIDEVLATGQARLGPVTLTYRAPQEAS